MSSTPCSARGPAARRRLALGLATVTAFTSAFASGRASAGEPPATALAAEPPATALAGEPPATALAGEPSAAPSLVGEPPAAPPPAAAPGVQHAIGVQGSWSNVDAVAGLSYRVRFPSGWQLGLDARYAPLYQGYISGYPVERGTAFAGSVLAMIPWARSGPLELDLRLAAGGRAIDADETLSPERRSTTLTTEFGPVVNVHAAPWLTVRAGWLNVLNLQLAPSTDIDALGQILLAGVAVPIGDRLLAHADFETGGLLGYDGDGGKYLTRVSVGLRWVLGEPGTRPWTTF